jgi:hypothetical protein
MDITRREPGGTNAAVPQTWYQQIGVADLDRGTGLSV